jgi:hypothetical protein
MLRIALNLRGTPVLHRDQNPASVGAIVRTRGMDDLFRHRSIIECSGGTPAAREKKTGGSRGRPL